MTEEEWLVGTRLAPLLGVTHADASIRKITLLGCTACRKAGSLVGGLGRDLENGVESTERYRDGDIARSEWREVYGLVEACWEEGCRQVDGSSWPADLPGAIRCLFLENDCHRAAPWLVEAVSVMAGPRFGQPFEAEICHLVRDIFGNPFRPVAFSPDWRTSTAVAIAQGMYESRDFSAMPILADALQDAGCDSDDILNHCRDENGTHVRGCWVVDLVLGKQ